MNLVGGATAGFHLSAIGEKGAAWTSRSPYDESSYLNGIRDFCTMFRTGKTDEDCADHVGAGGGAGGVGEIAGEKGPSASAAMTEKTIQKSRRKWFHDHPT